MQKKWKIIFIVVSIFIAIGAAIGIYFAVKGRNPYTKEQQAFIDEIVNSNRPNNPPVDIGGGTLPGGVIGEDETGDTVIVDTGTGSDEIWQKDSTDPDGGYGKVETPTTDDEGQPFTYQTVVQVCGNFALVKNDVGNQAVINLAESKVVLNYTDLQDAENLKIISHYCVFTEVANKFETSTISTYNVVFYNLIDESSPFTVYKAEDGGWFSVEYLTNDCVALQGLCKTAVLCIQDTIDVLFEQAETYEVLGNANDFVSIDQVPFYTHIIDGTLYLKLSACDFYILNEETLFIESYQYYKNYNQNTLCYYSQPSNAEDIRTYIAPTYYVINVTQKSCQAWDNSYVWCPQTSKFEGYYIFTKYPVVQDVALGTVISNENATYCYYNSSFELVFQMPTNVGIVQYYNEFKDYFICNAGGRVFVVDRYGNVVEKHNENKNIITYNPISPYYVCEDENGFYYKVGVYGSEEFFDDFYVNFFTSWKGYYILEKQTDGVSSYDIYTPDKQVISINNMMELTAQEQGALFRAGYYITCENNSIYTIWTLDGEVVVSNAENTSIVLLEDVLYLNYMQNGLCYTYKISQHNMYLPLTIETNIGINNTGYAAVGGTAFDTTMSILNASGDPITITGDYISYSTSTGSIDNGKDAEFIVSEDGIFYKKDNASLEYYHMNFSLIKKQEKLFGFIGLFYYYMGWTADIEYTHFFVKGAAQCYNYRDYTKGAAPGLGKDASQYFFLSGVGEKRIPDNETGYTSRVDVFAEAETAHNTILLNDDSIHQHGEGKQKPYYAEYNEKQVILYDVTPDIDVNNGVKVNVPVKEGYKFLGYYDGVFDNATQIFNKNGEFVGSYTVTRYGDKTLYAHWEPLVTTVNFSSNSSGDYQVVSSKYYTYGEEVPKLTINAPEKIGYNFLGWYTRKNGQGTRVFHNDGKVADTSISTGYIKEENSKYYWNRDYDYNTSGANQITLYAYYEPKEMSVEVNVVANDEGVDTGQISYALLGGDLVSGTSETYLYSKTYLYDATNVTNRIEIKMSEALGYYISEFKITWKTFDNDNELNTSLIGTSDTYESIAATNGINKNFIEKSISGQTVAIIPNKTVSGNTATYSFDFKSGTGQDSSYLNTWEVVLTIYINIELIITPTDTVQTSAESINVEPAILPQNRKEEA